MYKKSVLALGMVVCTTEKNCGIDYRILLHATEVTVGTVTAQILMLVLTGKVCYMFCTFLTLDEYVTINFIHGIDNLKNVYLSYSMPISACHKTSVTIGFNKFMRNKKHFLLLIFCLKSSCKCIFRKIK